MDGYNKYQFSMFTKDEGQYVVRTDDKEEFKQMVADVRKAVGPQAPNTSVRSNSVPTAEKPKVPYMWASDTCPVCNKGLLTRTMKVSKTGEKYDALICDQPNCKGFAYVSKYPKPMATGAMPTPDKGAGGEIEVNDVPF